MDEKPERRKVKRPYLMYYTNVYDAQELLGRLVDLTPQGAMVISEKPVPVDQVKQLRLELSDDFSERRFLEFSARSLWCKPDIDPQFYDTGFELLDVPPEDIAIIESIVKAYALPRETGSPE